MQKIFPLKKFNFLAAFFISYLLCGTSLAMGSSCYVVSDSDLQVTFTGCIEKIAVDELIARMAAAPQKKLSLSSTGGEIVEAIRLTKFLNAQKTNVKIVEQCMSSCANYLLLYLDKVSIAPDTVILFHGRLWDSLIRERADKTTAGILSDIQKIEEEFIETKKRAKFALDLVSKILLPEDYFFEIKDGVGPDCKGPGLGAPSLIILPATLVDFGISVKIIDTGTDFKLNLISKLGNPSLTPPKINCTFHE